MYFRLVLILALFTACKPVRPIHEKFALAGNQSGSTLGQILIENEGVVIVFLSPECPLCKNYTSTLRDIKALSQMHNIALIGAVSGTFYADTTIIKYLEFFNLDIPVLLDPEFQLSKYYEATITPEVCLINKSGELMYRGAIDNWAISLGQKRQVITEHYLVDAIESFAERRPIHPKTTKPVGCFIQ